MTNKYEKAINKIKESSSSSSIYVGCDSQVFSRKDKKTGRAWKEAKYSTSVWLHKDSKHGASIIFSEKQVIDDYGNIKQRLMNEVFMVTEVALALIDHVGERNFEVHVDINADEKHASSVAVKEAIGYVTGQMGFAPKVKPHAFAASHSSDHIVKNKMKGFKLN